MVNGMKKAELVRTDPRTHEEVCLDVSYSVRWNELNEILFSRVDAAIKIVSLLLSTGAVAGYLADEAALSALSGLLLAFLTIFDVVVSPGRKICEFNEAGRRFAELYVVAPRLPMAELDADWRRLCAQYKTRGINALQPIAHNANLRTHGRPDAYVGTNRWQRFVGGLSGAGL